MFGFILNFARAHRWQRLIRHVDRKISDSRGKLIFLSGYGKVFFRFVSHRQVAFVNVYVYLTILDSMYLVVYYSKNINKLTSKYFRKNSLTFIFFVF